MRNCLSSLMVRMPSLTMRSNVDVSRPGFLGSPAAALARFAILCFGFCMYFTVGPSCRSSPTSTRRVHPYSSARSSDGSETWAASSQTTVLKENRPCFSRLRVPPKPSATQPVRTTSACATMVSLISAVSFTSLFAAATARLLASAIACFSFGSAFSSLSSPGFWGRPALAAPFAYWYLAVATAKFCSAWTESIRAFTIAGCRSTSDCSVQSWKSALAVWGRPRRRTRRPRRMRWKFSVSTAVLLCATASTPPVRWSLARASGPCSSSTCRSRICRR
mmetsp:Transcript_3919/g.11351  ORF Transcript_3919/g.11351 Transcript_3919/m.11351 type:complete len:277 (-) Transcript_3919:403-1233(-)